MQYYNRTGVHSEKSRKNKSVGSCTYRVNNFASIFFFSLKIKQKDLSFRKVKISKRSLIVVSCSFSLYIQVSYICYVMHAKVLKQLHL